MPTNKYGQNGRYITGILSGDVGLQRNTLLTYSYFMLFKEPTLNTCVRYELDDRK